MKSPAEIYKEIEKRGGFHKVEEKTGLTRTEILRAVRDGEPRENLKKVADAVGLSVAELTGRK